MKDRRRFPFAVLSVFLMSLSTVIAHAAAADGAAAAPPTPVAQFKVFKIGGYRAVALKDGVIEMPNDGKSFVVGQSNEAVGAVLKAGGAPADHLEFSIQPLLVHAGKHVLLFDTGVGNWYGDIGGKLPDSMKAAGEKPASVTDIFISHAHGDHIGGLITPSGALAFPNATIHMSAPEWNWLSNLTETQAKNMAIQHVSVFVMTIKPKVLPFQPGANLLPGIVKAVELKGHTPGHSGYLIGEGPDSVLVFGDAMHSFVISVGKPSWQVAFDSDQQLGAATRVTLVNNSVATGQRLYSEHFPFPGIGKIVKTKDGTFWQPESLH
ncbi:MAG TPA: MBL fold metallo-hydrolase [Steroidobacteraceae bacterium]|jgi:glyoxylase-like metal-dependent hydrolase (beta-lactamase superfamily II)|nr:MBL fold metallo-hydrolase [Steroidobacteraceae bacterium]